MSAFRGFFKVFSGFKSKGLVLNHRKRSKQVALSVLVLLLTVSIVLAVPETSTTSTTSLNPSTKVSTKAIGKALVNKTYGGTDNEVGHWVEQTSDGGYIIIGDKMVPGGYDIWLIKTYPNGTEEWNKTYGGANYEEGFCVRQTNDKGYIITGYTESYGNPGVYDVWLVKTYENGTLEWNKTFGGAGFYDVGRFVEQTDDGGYIITGYTRSYGMANTRDVWLIKTDLSGVHEWNQTFGFLDDDDGYCVRQTSDGGYIITGYTLSYGFGNGDVWVIKTNATGYEEWGKFYGDIREDSGQCVVQTTDGGYIIVGTTNTTDNYFDIYLVKTNANGNKIWEKTYGGTNYDIGRCVEQTIDGGYIFTGETASFSAGAYDVWLIKTNSSGDKLWDKTYGGTASDSGKCVQQTSEGGFVIVGYTYSFDVGGGDVWLIKPDMDPLIDHPDDITYVEGTTGNTITWNPSDENPSNYKVTREGILVNSSSWDGGSITLNVDGLSIGNYTYKCTVYDTSDQNASDTVIVRVTSQVPEFQWSMIFTIIAVIGIAIVIRVVLAKHNR